MPLKLFICEMKILIRVITFVFVDLVLMSWKNLKVFLNYILFVMYLNPCGYVLDEYYK